MYRTLGWIAAVLTLAICVPALADDWAKPTPRTYTSRNQVYRLTVFPRSVTAEAQPVTAWTATCEATLEKLEGNAYGLLWLPLARQPRGAAQRTHRRLRWIRHIRQLVREGTRGRRRRDLCAIGRAHSQAGAQGLSDRCGDRSAAAIHQLDPVGRPTPPRCDTGLPGAFRARQAQRLE